MKIETVLDGTVTIIYSGKLIYFQKLLQFFLCSKLAADTDEETIYIRPIFFGKYFNQFFLSLLGGFCMNPAEEITDSMNMCIHRNGGNVEGAVQDQVRCFPAHPRQTDKVGPCHGDFSAIPCKDVPCKVM